MVTLNTQHNQFPSLHHNTPPLPPSDSRTHITAHSPHPQLAELKEKLTQKAIYQFITEHDPKKTQALFKQARALFTTDSIRTLLSGPDAALNAEAIRDIAKMLRREQMDECLSSLGTSHLQNHRKTYEQRKNDWLFEFIMHYGEGASGACTNFIHDTNKMIENLYSNMHAMEHTAGSFKDIGKFIDQKPIIEMLSRF